MTFRASTYLALVGLLAAGATGCRRPPPGQASAAVGGSSTTSVPAEVRRAPAGVTSRVVIVGGGLAGLVSAYELGKRGISTELLEATEVWGGRVATASYGEGTYAEYGMQEMWTDNPLLGIARELGVPVEAGEEAYSSLVLDGKLVPYVQPTAEKFFASFLDPGERPALERFMKEAGRLYAKARAADGSVVGHVLGPELEALQSVSFAEWVGRLALPRRVSEWIRVTVECEVATDWRSFSGLSGLLESRFFLRPAQLNYQAKGGNAQVIKALAGAIPGKKTLLATVTAVERWQDPDGRPRARVSYLRGQHLETVEADRVILSVPFYRLHQIRMDPPLSDEKWQAILTLARGQYTVVHLLMDKDARKVWAGPGRSPFPVLTDGPLGVVYGVAHESPPSEPLEVFSLLVHGAAAAAFHMIPREVKVREILTALDKLWPGLSGHVRSSQVFSYHPAALPVWPPGRSPLDPGARALREPELGLYLAGDYTLGAHSSDAVESGQRVAARIAADLALPASPTVAPPRSPPPLPPSAHRTP